MNRILIVGVLVVVAIGAIDALKCYKGIGDGWKSSDCEEGQDVCKYYWRNEKITSMGCAKAADMKEGKEVIDVVGGSCKEEGLCYCATDLCNGTTNLTSASGLFFVLLAFIVNKVFFA